MAILLSCFCMCLGAQPLPLIQEDNGRQHQVGMENQVRAQPLEDHLQQEATKMEPLPNELVYGGVIFFFNCSANTGAVTACCA